MGVDVRGVDLPSVRQTGIRRHLRLTETQQVTYQDSPGTREHHCYYACNDVPAKYPHASDSSFRRTGTRLHNMQFMKHPRTSASSFRRTGTWLHNMQFMKHPRTLASSFRRTGTRLHNMQFMKHPRTSASSFRRTGTRLHNMQFMKHPRASASQPFFKNGDTVTQQASLWN